MLRARVSWLCALSLLWSASVWADDETPPFEIGVGLSGAWYNPSTPGQGWMLDVVSGSNLFFAAWFTWRGEGDHDWFTVQGSFAGDRAEVPLLRTEGGRYNDPTPTEIDVVGQAHFRFWDCRHGEVELRFDDHDGIETLPLYRLTPAPHACRQPPEAVQFRIGSRAAGDDSEDFVVATRDPDLIAAARAQLNLPEDQRSMFVHGALARGDGGINAPWSWHVHGNAWQLVEVSIELCDGRASDIEADLEYWIDTVGSFCPWSSYVKAEVSGELAPDPVDD